jgi:hypothetical protein
MIKKRLNKKRLAVDLPIEIHNEIKEQAEKRRCTITKYIICVLRRVIQEEKRYE